MLYNFDENKYSNYSLKQYVNDVENLGLKLTWDYICEYVLNNGETDFISVSNFGELYEIGLAIQDKKQKKKSGQYYTPDDVAAVMSEWLLKESGHNVCDVACGTGKLILTYLNLIGYDEARKLINDGRLYLYDFDLTALKICKTSILIKYKIDDENLINCHGGDFMSSEVVLPPNAKVISNPPYAAIDNIPETWIKTDVVLKTKEYYSIFMEKIFSQANSTVIITPFSFISGKKFYPLRKQMCLVGNGSIFAFDNVPGNIFCGRKHGIFNTNTANSVRAAITILRKGNEKGFKVTPLIRFKNEQRKQLLVTSVLENCLNQTIQVVNQNNQDFNKVSRKLDALYTAWNTKSRYIFKDFLEVIEGDYLIDMPNTCRYFTTASSKKLSRNGSITCYFEDEKVFNFLYCFINSSFTYWWWRVFDGGITYPISLLKNMPVPYNLLNDDDHLFFKNLVKEMTENEDKYKIIKMNAGEAQENIKFPVEYRNKINSRIVTILGEKFKPSMFDEVHANEFINEE